MAKTINWPTKIFKIGGFLCLLYFFSTNQGLAQSITFSAEKRSASAEYGRVSITGLKTSYLEMIRSQQLSDKEWLSFFSVRVEGSSRPMLGTFLVDTEKISFDPRFLPDPEVTYGVIFSPSALKRFVSGYPISDDLSWNVRFDDLDEIVNEVEYIFPESETLPANILRFYIHFSQPSDFQNPFDYIHIENEKGEIIPEPFVEMEEGLWSSDRRRLTILIHPGRIKRNVGPNMTMGEVFEEGQRYRMVISEKWNLKRKFVKSFQIEQAIRSTIDVERWKVEVPDANSLDNLIIRTSPLLDKALTERLISVLANNGSPVLGNLRYSSVDSILVFSPKEPWHSSTYTIDVHPKLEDVSGNTPVGVFDVEGQGAKEKPVKYQLTFEVDN